VRFLGFYKKTKNLKFGLLEILSFLQT